MMDWILLDQYHTSYNLKKRQLKIIEVGFGLLFLLLFLGLFFWFEPIINNIRNIFLLLPLHLSPLDLVAGVYRLPFAHNLLSDDGREALGDLVLLLHQPLPVRLTPLVLRHEPVPRDEAAELITVEDVQLVEEVLHHRVLALHRGIFPQVVQGSGAMLAARQAHILALETLNQSLPTLLTDSSAER